MITAVFNDPDYLEIEAARLSGSSAAFDLGNGFATGAVRREIPGCDVSDLVSVYGYPDLVQPSPNVTQVDTDTVLTTMAKAASAANVVTAYLRLGLTQDVTDPVASDRGYQAVRAAVGEVVVVDLASGPEAATLGYRQQMRNEFRRDNRLDIRRSDDYASFHAIYTQNMTRVNASESYFFSTEYLRALCAIAGVELWLAHDAVGAVAGGIFIRHGDLVYYHLGATADRALATSPLKHVLHQRIQALAADGTTRSLVLGGGVGGGNDALLRFKRGFSKRTRTVYSLRVVFDPDAYLRLSGPDALPVSANGFFPAYRAQK